MNYLKSLFRKYKYYKEISPICKKYGIINYTINGDGSINVNDNVYLGFSYLIKLPLKFNIVNGNFDCSYNKLISLEGAPKELSGHFNCSHNELTNLIGCPKEINGSFNCSSNRLYNLKNAPKKIKNDFYIINNSMVSLEGLPDEISGNFYYGNNSIDLLLNQIPGDKYKKFFKIYNDYTPMKNNIIKTIRMNSLFDELECKIDYKKLKGYILT